MRAQQPFTLSDAAGVRASDRFNVCEGRRQRTAILISPSTPCYTDVKDVKVVVNFDMPNAAEDYVHRIGQHHHSV